MAHADHLQAAVQRMIAAQFPLRQVNVTRVNDDGTVDLDGAEGQITDVACSSAYATRVAGDKVILVRFPGGNFEVLARSESPDPAPPAPIP